MGQAHRSPQIWESFLLLFPLLDYYVMEGKNLVETWERRSGEEAYRWYYGVGTKGKSFIFHRNSHYTVPIKEKPQNLDGSMTWLGDTVQLLPGSP